MDSRETNPPASAAPVESLWRLERLAPRQFRGWCRDGAVGRVFGGQVVAQALAAAGQALSTGDLHRPVRPTRHLLATADTRWRPLSLHAYFVREGRSAAPIEYEVRPIGTPDPASVVISVTAGQNDKTIFLMDAAFCPIGADQLTPWQFGPEPPSWQPADPGDAQWITEHARRAQFALRFPAEPTRITGRAGRVSTGQQFWFRTDGGLDDDPLSHACALAYVSDMFLVSAGLAAGGLPGRHPDVVAASLDHALWFHRLGRADTWVRYEQGSVSAAGGRGLTRGELFDQSGAALATVRQEILQRLPSP